MICGLILMTENNMGREAGASAKAKIAEQRMAAGLHPVPPVIVDGDPVLAFAYDSLIAYACFSWPKFETAAHHMMIAKYLHKVESGEIRRLIINMPPRHGKSMLTSQFFPAWYLGRNPDKRLVIVSKSGDLAGEFGRNVRNLVADPVYSEIFPGVRLSESSSAVDDFNLAMPHKGGVFTVGVGGMLSGRGANCVVGETKVETEHGPIDISTLYLMEEKPKVLSYNHSTKQLEYKSIIATKQSKTDYLMEFFTRAGNHIRVTKEHQIFHPGHGYLEAEEFVFGDEMYCIPVGSGEKIGTKPLPSLERSLLSEIGRFHYANGSVIVFDIQVEDNENFFANGILVHNCLILDDTVRDRADAESETQQKKIMDWYTSTAYTRLMDNGSIVICNTRWTCNDLCGQLIRDHKHEDWVVLNLPAISYIDGKEEALWPEKYPLEELHRIKKTLPARDWEALYQQKPFVSEGGIFKREWWQKLSGYKAPECSFIIQSYDTAYSTKDVKRNSFSARTTWGVFKRPDDEVPNVLLLEAWQDHLEYPELRKEVLRAYKEYQPDKVIIEDKASGAILIQELRRSGVPVTAWNPQGSKTQRAQELTTAYVTQSLFENGRVFHPDRRWAFDVIDMACEFPNGAHDDIVDTIVQALTWLQKSWLVHHSDLKEEEEKDTIDEEDDDFLGKNVTRFRAKRKRIGYG